MMHLEALALYVICALGAVLKKRGKRVFNVLSVKENKNKFARINDLCVWYDWNQLYEHGTFKFKHNFLKCLIADGLVLLLNLDEIFSDFSIF